MSQQQLQFHEIPDIHVPQRINPVDFGEFLDILYMKPTEGITITSQFSLNNTIQYF